jgi:hypothetical protein
VTIWPLSANKDAKMHDIHLHDEKMQRKKKKRCVKSAAMPFNVSKHIQNLRWRMKGDEDTDTQEFVRFAPKSFSGSDERVPLNDPHPRFDHEFFNSWHFEPFYKSYNFQDFARVLHWYHQVPLKLRLSHSQLLRLHSPVSEKEEWSSYFRHWFDLFNDAFFLGAFDSYPVQIIIGFPGYYHTGPHVNACTHAVASPRIYREGYRGLIIQINIRDHAKSRCKNYEETQSLHLLSLLHEMNHAFFMIFACIHQACASHRNHLGFSVKPYAHGPEWADCMRLLLDAFKELINWPEVHQVVFDKPMMHSVLGDMVEDNWKATPSQLARWGFNRYRLTEIKLGCGNEAKLMDEKKAKLNAEKEVETNRDQAKPRVEIGTVENDKEVSKLRRKCLRLMI